jgi:hypothetical protein
VRVTSNDHMEAIRPEIDGGDDVGDLGASHAVEE